MNQTVQQAAERFHELGFKVFPVSKETKQPACKSWRQYEKPISKKELKKLFEKANGIALACCDGIEVIDVDLKYSLDDSLFTKLLDSIFSMVGEEVLNSLILAQTKSGGYHILYKTSIEEGNQKLASRITLDEEKKHEKDDRRVLLETRSLGGYVVLAPTEGYKWDNPFSTIAAIPTLEDWQRNSIIQCCRDFDELGEVYVSKEAKIPTETKISGKSTIEAFNEAHTPLDFVVNEGWQYKNSIGANERYVRPGKALREGHGATYNRELERFYVFTSSTIFEPDKSYDAFGVYAALYHNNDYSAASKKLYHEGYGDRITKNKDSHVDKLDVISNGNDATKKQLQDNNLMLEIDRIRFDINRKPKAEKHSIFIWDSFKQDHIGIGNDGEMIVVAGGSKSRKSAFSSMAVASCLEGGMGEALMFKSDLQKRNVLHLDTEQGDADYYKAIKEMFWQANIKNGYNPRNFHSYRLTDYDLETKISYLDYKVNQLKNIGLVWLDGIVDLVKDYNNLEESKMLVDYLRQLASKHNFLLLTVLHNARSTGAMRGHLGSFLENKAKAVVNCTKDKDMGFTKIEFTHTRGFTPPQALEFEHDSNGHLQFLK